MTILDTLRPHRGPAAEPRPPWRSRIRTSNRATFASLRQRNYRLFFTGQAISLVGTWMQAVAQSLLVFHLTGSGTWVGLVIAAQTLPVLLGGPYGGLVADRLNKRRLLTATQAYKGLLGLGLGLTVALGTVQLWMVVAFAVGLGIGNVFDNPARQTFIPEMVGADLLGNAISLNSILVNAARAVGPAIAGILIATVGYSICFMLDAGSYVAVVVALLLMDATKLHRSKPSPRTKGQVREGLRYVRRTPELFVPLLMMTLVGALAYEFQVSLPVLALHTFDGGPDTYGFMTAAMGVGAIFGGFRVARRTGWGVGPLMRATSIFGIAILALALSPWLWLAMIALLFVGATSIGFLAGASTTLQLTADPQMRGRVMALWAVAFLGTTPIGGPIVGWVAQHAGARWALGLGAVAAIGAAVLGRAMLRRADKRGATQRAAALREAAGPVDLADLTLAEDR